MATETGAPDNCTTPTPPSPVGGAQEVEEKAEQVEVAEHGKIGYAPKEEMKEVNMCKGEDIAKLQDQPEEVISERLGAPESDESVLEAATNEKQAEVDLDESAREAATSEMEDKTYKEQVKLEIVEENPEEDIEKTDEPKPRVEAVESKGQSYVSEVVERTVKATKTLEALMRKEKENEDESIEGELEKDDAPNGSIQHTEEVVEVPSEKKIQESEVRARAENEGRDERKTEELAASEDPEPNEEKATKQSNNVISKVKHALVKAKRAIIGISPSLKDAKG